VGQIRRLDLGTGAARSEPDVGDHHHLVCARCGKVRDVHADHPRPELPADRRQGLEGADADVVLSGRCEARAGAAR